MLSEYLSTDISMKGLADKYFMSANTVRYQLKIEAEVNNKVTELKAVSQEKLLKISKERMLQRESNLEEIVVDWYLNGEWTQQAIANKFGIHRATVRRILQAASSKDLILGRKIKARARKNSKTSRSQ